MLSASFHARVGVGKQPADVARRGRAEHRVGHGMADDVGIRVAVRPEIERNRDTAEDSGRPATRRCRS